MRAVETTQKSDLTFSTEVVGDRPAGQIPTGHPLVQLAAATLRYVGLNALYETGSTDANVLLANGLPTVTIGISYGGHAHREDEFIETGPIPKGIWQTILLALGAADYLSP
jgi:di/tripeptidase